MSGVLLNLAGIVLFLAFAQMVFDNIHVTSTPEDPQQARDRLAFQRSLQEIDHEFPVEFWTS